MSGNSFDSFDIQPDRTSPVSPRSNSFGVPNFQTSNTSVSPSPNSFRAPSFQASNTPVSPSSNSFRAPSFQATNTSPLSPRQYPLPPNVTPMNSFDIPSFQDSNVSPLSPRRNPSLSSVSPINSFNASTFQTGNTSPTSPRKYPLPPSVTSMNFINTPTFQPSNNSGPAMTQPNPFGLGNLRSATKEGVDVAVAQSNGFRHKNLRDALLRIARMPRYILERRIRETLHTPDDAGANTVADRLRQVVGDPANLHSVFLGLYTVPGDVRFDNLREMFWLSLTRLTLINLLSGYDIIQPSQGGQRGWIYDQDQRSVENPVTAAEFTRYAYDKLFDRYIAAGAYGEAGLSERALAQMRAIAQMRAMNQPQ